MQGIVSIFVSLASIFQKMENEMVPFHGSSIHQSILG